MEGTPVGRAGKCPRCIALEDLARVLFGRILQLSSVVKQLRSRVKQLESSVKKLEGQVQKEARRAKRQAAPFSKGKKSAQPKRPGRKAGAQYGKRSGRDRPTRIDHEKQAPVPKECPNCSSSVRPTRTAEQYIIDMPEPRFETTRIEVGIGECTNAACGIRVQGRHPDQISDALGAAAVQLGPRLISLGCEMKVTLGVSWGKISRLLTAGLSCPVARSTLCRAFKRVSKKLKATQEALRHEISAAPMVTPDETGWRLGGDPAWLWVFVSRTISYYTVSRSRGFDVASRILGKSFSGVLVHDGWAVYNRFKMAIHQTCLDHLLRRCKRLLLTAKGETANFPAKVRELLMKGLALRDRKNAETISEHGFAVARGQLRLKLGRLLLTKPPGEDNERFFNHLTKEKDHLLTFLFRPGVHATNHRAEQELRPAISTRKACGGGNRTSSGADHFARILTVLRTAQLRGFHPIELLIRVLRQPNPSVNFLAKDTAAKKRKPP